MSNDRVLDLDELRTALGRVIDEVQRHHGPRIDLAADYYWTIEQADAYKFDTADPPEITVGHLSDDVESMQELLRRAGDEPVIVWHDLAHLVGILRRVAAMDLPTHS